MAWFKLHTRGVLRGSLEGYDAVIQLIWIKLLAIESETKTRDGWLHYAPGNPMSHERLASECGVSLDWFEEALGVFRKELDAVTGNPRIVEAANGDIYLTNWEYYQAKSDKAIAKEVAIEKAKRTGKTKGDVTAGLLRAANKINIAAARTEKANQGGKV